MLLLPVVVTVCHGWCRTLWVLIICAGFSCWTWCWAKRTTLSEMVQLQAGQEKVRHDTGKFTNDSRSVSCWAEGQRSCPCPHHRAVEDTAVPLSGGWRRSQDRRSTDGKDKVDNGKILEQKKWQLMTFADKSKCHLLYCQRDIRKDNSWLPGWTFDIPWMWRRKAKEMVCMKHAPGCVTLPYLKRQQSLNLRENSYMLHFPNVWGRYWCIYVYIRRCL